MRSFILPCSLLFACASSEEGIKIYNSTPTATITSHTDGTEFLESTLYTFVGQVSDDNHTSADLVVIWSSDTRELCLESSPNANGESSCQVMLDPTETKVQLQVTDPEGVAAMASIDVVVQESDAPTIELLSPTTEDAYYSDQLIPFSAVINDREDEPAELLYVWTSSRDGALSMEATPDSDGTISSFATLTEGQHAISLRVEDSSGKTTTRDVAIVVGGPNIEPQCGIDAPESGSGFVVGQNITFTAMASDDNINNSLLQISWTSDIDGVFNTTAPSTDGDLTVVYDALSIGNHIITLKVEDEVGGLCSDTVSLAVGTPPTLTLTAPMSGDVVSLGDSVSFVGTVSDEEDISNEITMSWVSDLDGVFSTQGSDSNGNLAFGYSALSSGFHNLTTTATDSDGLTTSVVRSLRINTPPSAPEVSILPEGSSTTDNLEVALVESPDLDGDTISYSYVWLKNGISTSYISTSVPASATSYGDVWTVRVTPNDGYTDGVFGEASAIIENTAPTLDSVGITPSAAYNDSVLTCLGTASDADQSVAVTYSWMVGTDTYTGDTLDLSSLSVSPNDGIVCTAHVEDDAGASDDASASVTVLNRDPSVSAVVIDPVVVYSNSSVSCSASLLDDDAEIPTHTVDWSVGGVSIGSGDSLQLDSTMLSVGDVLTCTVTASDSFGGSASGSVSASIQNTAPTIDGVSLVPTTPSKHDTLTCSAAASDIDGDTPSVDVQWENQTSGATYTSTSTGNGMAELDLSTVLVSAQDLVACVVTASDSSGDIATQTEMVEIANSAPTFDTPASITPNSGVLTNTVLSCSASSSDPDDGTLASVFSWYNGTTLLGTGSTYTVLSTETDVGDSISCVATAEDSDGETATSTASVMIENTVPTLSGSAIDLATVYNNDTVTCSAFVSDPDESLTVGYAWTLNGSLVGSGSSLDLSTTAAMPEDTLECLALVGDTQGESASETVSTIIANRLPSAPTIITTPDPALEGIDDLSCSVDVASSDDDGQSVLYSYAWIDPDGTTQQTTLETASLNDTYLAAGTMNMEGIWTCEVTPSDGVDAGSMVSSTLVVEPEVSDYVGVIEMPESGTINGYSGYWNCNGGMRTVIRVTLTENCTDPEIAIYQHSSADSSIQGSYYIMNESGTVLDFTPFETHSNCNPSGQGGWCTPQQFSGITLEAETAYWLAFQNGNGACDMSGPSVYTDSNARTVGIATFDQPRMDNPGSDTRGLPSTSVSWQNRWQLVCF